ncbi:MrcB family domain-containing protein [Levilactobacillus brevis]|uniref:MrcB family domain-containing protein n=1 Tax=Levilactobacillus brevis TaxID=1580 RepID=UPI003D16A892
MLTLKDYLIHVLNDYQNESQKSHGNNSLATYISGKISDVIPRSIIPRDKYTIKASSGQGNWAKVPWIGIFNNVISTSAERGYDIVYLFRSDCAGVYLSLNQGYTYFREKYSSHECDSNIQLISNYWQANLPLLLANTKFKITDIDLAYNENHTSLPKGYELGNIYSRYYSLLELETIDNNRLLSDLNRMNLVFMELSNSLNESYDQFNDSIIKNNNTNYLAQQVKDKNTDFSSMKLGHENPVPTASGSPINSQISPKHTHNDYEKRGRRNRNLAQVSERMVLEEEKKRLSSIPRLRSLSNKIEHTSKLIGDGTGYDIKSYAIIDDKIVEYFIEVKATTGNINSPFFMSQNEINVAKEKLERYEIFRLYKSKEGCLDYYRIINPFSNPSKVICKPMQYSVRPN